MVRERNNERLYKAWEATHCVPRGQDGLEVTGCYFETNGIIEILCYSIHVLREGLTAVEDVEVTKDKVDLEIAKLRAHDSETSGTLKKLPCVQQQVVFVVISLLCNAVNKFPYCN